MEKWLVDGRVDGAWTGADGWINGGRTEKVDGCVVSGWVGEWMCGWIHGRWVDG